MSPKEDVEFLALLVHRGHLVREQAEVLLPHLKAGAPLDELLCSELGLDPSWVERMRRTRAGEIPEIPGYEILGKLGTGGTADVFRARDAKSRRTIALKVLNREATRAPATRKAFIEEARLLERLSHKGLVKGFGVAKSGKTYFSRMELVDGATLLELLDRGQAFDESAALRVVLEVAEVLSYLAEEGVIHRDVKAGNIMLSSAGLVKLIDLGFAAAGDAPPQAEGTTAGTVAYLSPEAASGEGGPDMRSDIYSLGVTLFQLVVGRLPFESTDDRELLRMQIMESLSSPELKSRGLSPHLHYFIEKMMAKDKDVRYQSWSALIDDVRRQLEGRDSLDFRRGAERRRPSSPGGRR